MRMPWNWCVIVMRGTEESPIWTKKDEKTLLKGFATEALADSAGIALAKKLRWGK